MTPQQVYPICRNRLGIEFNFRNAKQHLCLTAYRACTGIRYHFHAGNMPGTLARAWWGMCQAAGWAVPIRAEGDQSKPVFHRRNVFPPRPWPPASNQVGAIEKKSGGMGPGTSTGAGQLQRIPSACKAHPIPCQRSLAPPLGFKHFSNTRRAPNEPGFQHNPGCTGSSWRPNASTVVGPVRVGGE